MSQTATLIRDAVEKHGTQRENLLPIMQDVVKVERSLSEEAVIEIAEALDMSAAEVYGAASFYTFLDMKPRGKNVIRICKTITCYMKGKNEIINAIEDRLKLRLGETSSDGKFSFLAANCIGWCHEGSAMLINDRVYTKLTPQKAIEAINEHF